MYLLKKQYIKFKDLFLDILFKSKGIYQNFNTMKHSKYGYKFDIDELNQFECIKEFQNKLINKNYPLMDNFLKDFIFTHDIQHHQPNNLAFLIKNKNICNNLVVENTIEKVKSVSYINIDLNKFKKYENNSIIIKNEFYNIFLDQIDNLSKIDQQYYLILFFQFIDLKYGEEFLKLNIIEILENFNWIQNKFNIDFSKKIDFKELNNLIDISLVDIFNKFYNILLINDYKENEWICYLKLIGCVLLNHEINENLIYPNLYFNFLYEYLNYTSKLHPLSFEDKLIEKKNLVIHIKNTDLHLMDDNNEFIGNIILNTINTNNMRNSIPVIINIDKDSYFANHRVETLLKIPSISTTTIEFNFANYLYLVNIIDNIEFLNKFIIFYFNLFADDIDNLKYFWDYVIKNNIKKFDMVKDFRKLEKFDTQYQLFLGKINKILSNKNILTNYDFEEKNFYLYLLWKKFSDFSSAGYLFIGHMSLQSYLNDPFIITLIEENILGLEKNRSLIYLKKPLYKVFILNYLRDLEENLSISQKIRLKIKYFFNKKTYYFTKCMYYIYRQENKLEKMDYKFKADYHYFKDNLEFDKRMSQYLNESNIKMMALKHTLFNNVRDNITNKR